MKQKLPDLSGGFFVFTCLQNNSPRFKPWAIKAAILSGGFFVAKDHNEHQEPRRTQRND